jgi:glycosyltransferase involved in cell wall biosynthesis
MLAPPEDSEAMANALRKLADSPELFARMSAAAARRIRSTRSRKSVISADLALLRGVIDG